MIKKAILFIFIFEGMGITFAHAQTLRKYAEQKQQEIAERKRMEQVQYEKACQIGTLAAYNEYLSLYPKGQYVEDVNSRIAELERIAERTYYENVRKLETTQAYQEYLNKYPKGQYVQEAREHIADLKMWQDAKTKNTIAAYRNYLSSSPYKSFSHLANAAIADLESVEEWNRICNTTSKSLIESFISKYPNSSCIEKAKKRYNELLAIDYYNQGNLQNAYEKFEAAGGRSEIDFSNRPKYDVCLEYVDFKKLDTSKESNLLAFLKKHPYGSYYNHVSNMVAIAKAKKLTMFSSTNNFNEALSYAKDAPTLNTVQSYIDHVKRSYRQYKRSLKWQRHNANGKIFQIGIEMMDLGYNPSAYQKQTYLDIAWFYNMGVSLKIGNYLDIIQFEVGAKPGVVGYTLWHSSTDDELKVRFHLPLFARLKIPLFSLGNDSKLFTEFSGYYNVETDQYLENKFAISGGIGTSWHHWDWSIYYKIDLDNKKELDNDFLATSFKYYFSVPY